MTSQAVIFPYPFGKIDFINLVEPAGEQGDQLLFVHRLYLVNRFTEGGKTLIAQYPAPSLPKQFSCSTGEA